MNFFLETLRLGLANLMLHKLRSLLTAMGIIIGVAAVVAIAAYGEGAKQAALANILDLGATNIIVRSVKPPETASAGDTNNRMSMYGLKRLDLRRIDQTVGPIERIVPMKRVGSEVLSGVRTVPAAAVLGTTPELLKVTSLRVDRGRYITRLDGVEMAKVAVIGAEVAEQLFPLEDPIGQQFRVDDQAFTVIGVLGRVGLAGGAGSALVGRDLNFDIHIPMAVAESVFGDIRMVRGSGSREASQVELTELVIRVPTKEDVRDVAGQVERVIELEHAEQKDVTMIVPLELIRQAERTQLIFNVLMIVVAGLSLLVGGIGIMNIMLASVTERTREIGIRRAMGATRRHIVAQFLVETTVLSGIGGVIGVLIGLFVSLLVGVAAARYATIEAPQVTQWSIIVSFLVATLVGVFFGLYPAIRAANQDPIVALRHD